MPSPLPFDPKKVPRDTEGKDQLNKIVGKPKVDDTVKVHYVLHWLKNSKRDGTVIDTKVHKLVSFKVTSKPEEHNGLYQGLNEAVKGMNLGEEANVILTPDLAYGGEGLSRYYNASSGFFGSSMEVIGVALPDDPKAPADHKVYCIL